MEFKTFKSELILLLAATIWGFAFVAQRMGMDHVGPFTYNGIRFALGGASLLPFLLVGLKRQQDKIVTVTTAPSLSFVLKSGVFAGIFLFSGASLQQVGLVYTTAGKAGFITGLYVVIVPFIGLLWKQKSSPGIWGGALLAAVGLYFLSITRDMSIEYGDFLEFLGAFCFACHVVIIGRLANRIDTVQLSMVQCGVCSVLSLCVAVVFEEITWQGISAAALPIVYGGVFSVGVAYSLQIYGQKGSHPASAAILLSLESVIAALGGWLVLNEMLSGRAFFGCVLMMAGMLLSQLYPYLVGKRGSSNKKEAKV
ncbi:Permease of the drug/metabolite transporter (DMT) superfamily [Desulfocicer vacuolatum DSM 3385]|uniref:Permease of the drug/metabolite transporter (DMT) superfamily n=1 Tax=Desulfocicer vacuolatum DSM 3385 TaxID=1121400 RepID=A0A1W2E1V6_9BACT|nr:DMT family transporter [Desulfocicer vacuolatum]SMD03695.1 Permease of the drug/metabolite transporter (DMT) superfamily [Desulfocicer vacuolatum DSM 3385]